MNPGPWFPDPDRRRKNASQEPEDDVEESSIADVYNSFSLSSGRSRRQGRSRREESRRDSTPSRQEDSSEAKDEREQARETFRSPDIQQGASGSAPGPPVPGQSMPGTPVPGLPVQGQRSSAPPPPSAQSMPGAAIPGQQSAFGRSDLDDSPDLEAADDDFTVASSIRSYTWTGGRTKSNHALEMETLVSTSDTYRPGAMVRMEHQSIAEMCQHPRSVAEVGALMSVPIGVVRVLLADMAELGLITVHQTVSESGSAPHLMLMERVLSGLRRL